MVDVKNLREPMLGKMREADFEANTITFEMRGDYIATAGLYAIVPQAEHELLDIAEASEWQPIETAPKDGTRILALLRWGYSDGTAGETQTVIYWYGGGLFWVVPIPMNYVQGLDSDVAPTHWMPLPKPPEQETPND